MVANFLKPCCQICNRPDIKVENKDYYLRSGRKYFRDTRIYCSHAEVCKYYTADQKGKTNVEIFRGQ